MKQWIKNKLISVALAVNWTENSLKTSSEDIRLGEGKFQSQRKGMLSEDLINGEMTQEVMDLRWRMYKVLKQTANIESKIVGYDDNGEPIVETSEKTNSKHRLSKYKCDGSDDEFDLVMVMPNPKVVSSILDVDKTMYYRDTEVALEDYLAQFKDKRTLMVSRHHRPQFNIEDYTDKLLVRDMGNEAGNVLLEFYVHKYPTEERKSRFMVSEMKKILAGKHRSPVLDFEALFFISRNGLGMDDNLEYEFKLNKFHRIVEYSGYYVVKFVAEKIVYGDDLFDKYRREDLDEKYLNKIKK